MLVSIAVIVMAKSPRFREYARTHPVETVFLIPYLWCVYAYHDPPWARGSFARFSIPIVPFVLIVLYPWVPQDRRVLWTAGVVMSVLAAVSAIGVSSVMHALRG